MSFDSSHLGSGARSSSFAPNSKRCSPSSSSSNHHANTNNINRRKKKKTMTTVASTNHKTQGVAWGSNSLSSRKSPFSDFGSYMVEKNRKLHNQFVAEASTTSVSASGSTSWKPIFSGVSIFVDGFTVPSSQELRGYMLKYGGKFENYFSRHRITHIICSNLPDSKVKNLRTFSAGLPVVKPTWILDSVAANRLLSWVPYLLEQLASDQPKLSAFFAVKSSKSSYDSFTNALFHVEPDVEDSSLRVGQPKDGHSSEVGNMVRNSKEISNLSNDIVPENTNFIMFEELRSDRVICGEEEVAELSNSETNEERNVEGELEPNHREPSASTSSSFSVLQNVKQCPSYETTIPSKQCHSTLEDPNFVENYFKSSRLHFIGTWRNRYRKQFPISSAGFNIEISKTMASENSGKSVIIHVDMDCFFVSVVIRNHPELLNKPVAVCHSNNSKGTAEISSANYPARDYGVRAGMFVRDAKALCPHLVIFSYNFEAYEEVADQFYSILHRRCNKVQAVSCDEAFLDCTDSDVVDPELLASSIREEIYGTTGCTASAGIAENMLMARIATRIAKPNGQYCITPERVEDHLSQLPINVLPGIGYVLQEKLRKQNVLTCGQLQMISKASLLKDYGLKTGEMLWNYSRGIDNRLVGVIQENKSIGADVNWGVRFKDMKDCEHFLMNLCKEVSLRLQCCGVQGRTFTLKIKKRRKDADEPAKFMGCGDCENLSYSVTIPLATNTVEILQRIVKQLFGRFQMGVKEIRGVGLQVSRLENADASKQEKYTLKSWLTSGSPSMEKQRHPMGNGNCCQTGHNTQHQCSHLLSSVPMDVKIIDNKASANPISTPPPLCHLDVEVIRNLPPEVFSELNEIYGGKLVDCIATERGTCESGNSYSEQEGGIFKEEDLSYFEPIPQNKQLSEIEAMQYEVERVEAVPGSGDGTYSKVTDSLCFEKEDLLPFLSQVDASVLQQFPEDMKSVNVGQLPGHRVQAFHPNPAVAHSRNHQELPGISTSENYPESINHVLKDSLWAGDPPLWVDKFEASNCLILKKLAEMYHSLGFTSKLSSVLHQFISEFHQLDFNHETCDETVNNMCELLKQYIKVKIERDIEEIYICFRLLKRFAVKSQFFLQVYDNVFSYLQVAVDKNYGGRLFMPS